MKLKNSIKFCIVCIILVRSCFGMGQAVNAASEVNVSLEPGTVYSTYDVNGDGAADTVKIKVKSDEQSSGETASMQVIVNGNVVFEHYRDFGPVWEVKLIRLANGKVFFDIQSTVGSDDDCIHQLYTYQNGKFKSVYNFQKYYAKYADYYLVDIENVSGNTIELSARAQFYTTGSIRFNMNISYSDGKFELTSNTFAINYKEMYNQKNKWTAEKKIKVYKKAGANKFAYTLKKGNVAKLNKVVYKNNKVYFQVKNNKGKTGYIPAVKKYNGNYFRESVFAG